jgi:hypothetical protein
VPSRSNRFGSRRTLESWHLNHQTIESWHTYMIKLVQHGWTKSRDYREPTRIMRQFHQTTDMVGLNSLETCNFQILYLLHPEPNLVNQNVHLHNGGIKLAVQENLKFRPVISVG